MDIEYLRRFAVLGRELNYHKAAEHLFISQPALSHSIQILEKELNVSLFERNTKNVSLTEIGKTFLKSCSEVLNKYDEALELISKEASDEEKVLNIGYSGPALSKSLSPWIIEFRERYPEIDIHVVRYHSNEMSDALESKAIQMAFVYEEAINKNAVLFDLILIEKFMLMVNSSSPLAAYDSISLSEIKDEHFLVCRRESAPNYYDTVMGFFETAGITPNFSNEVKEISELYRLVDMNMGVAIMSVDDTSYYDNYHLKFIQIEDIDESRLRHKRVMAWTNEMTSPAKKFRKIVEDNPVWL